MSNGRVSGPPFSRRRALATGLAGALALIAPSAFGLGRTPLAGKLSFGLPWLLRAIDPHDPQDPLGALFGSALFDTLYQSRKGGAVPALAAGLPTREAGATTVRLRPGLRTAHGKGLDARDVIASLKRARTRGAPLDAAIEPSPHPKDGLALFFPKATTAQVLAGLSSPLTAIVPRDFDPAKPDGTGAFRATLEGKRLTLDRNESAALGPSFLETVRVRELPDLRASLREFEVGNDDLGWLGTGLFSSRTGGERFDLGAVGLLVIAATGKAGDLAKPGAMQRLADDLPGPAISHLGLGARPSGGGAGFSYDGPPIELACEGSPHLVETAQAIADAIGSKDHEVTVKISGRGEIAARRARGDALLSLHVLRDGGALARVLAGLDDPATLRSPPAKLPASPREAAKSLRVGVLGELRVFGGKLHDLALASAERGGWDLGASFMRKKSA